MTPKSPTPTEQKIGGYFLVNLSPAIRQALKIRAAQEQRPMQDLATDAIKAYLATPVNGSTAQ